MTSLRDALWASEPPAGSEAACERTVGVALSAPSGASGPRGRQRLRAILAASAGAALVLAATPQGRDAISWAAELVGVGKVGGPPTNEDRPELVSPASNQVVIAKGSAPDGSPYEVVAYRTDDPVAGETDVGATCVAVDFLPRRGPGGVTCGDNMLEPGRSLFVAGASGPGPSGVPADPFTSGYVAPEVAQVTIRTGDPPSREADAELVFLDGALKRRIGAGASIGFFLGFLPRDFDVQGLGAGTERLEVTAYDPAGNVLNREVIPDAGMLRDAARAREAFPPELP